MARRTFDLPTVIGLLQHWYVGRSHREKSASLDVDRKTLRDYVTPGAAAWIVPGGRANRRQEWAELVRGWLPKPADTRPRRVTWPGIGEHREFIAHQLEAGVRIIWQPLGNEHGLAVSVPSLSWHMVPSVRSRQSPAMPSRCGHRHASTTLRGGRDQLGHPIPQLSDLNDEDNQA